MQKVTDTKCSRATCTDACFEAPVRSALQHSHLRLQLTLSLWPIQEALKGLVYMGAKHSPPSNSVAVRPLLHKRILSFPLCILMVHGMTKPWYQGTRLHKACHICTRQTFLLYKKRTSVCDAHLASGNGAAWQDPKAAVPGETRTRPIGSSTQPWNMATFKRTWS